MICNSLKDFDDQEDHISDVESNASDINNGGYEDQIDYLLAQGATLARNPGDVERVRTRRRGRNQPRGRMGTGDVSGDVDRANRHTGGRPAPFGYDRWRYPTLPGGPRAAAGPLNQAPGDGRPSGAGPSLFVIGLDNGPRSGLVLSVQTQPPAE